MKPNLHRYAGPIAVGLVFVLAASGAHANVFTYTSYPQVLIPDSQEIDTCNEVPGVTLSNNFHIDPVGTIKDIDLRLNITHEYVGDLEVTLTSPQGTTVRVVELPGNPAVLGTGGGCGCSEDNLVTRLDDDSAGGAVEDACPPTGPDYTPQNPLMAFQGEDMSGPWTLEVRDWNQQDIGELVSWGLDVNYVPTAPIPADQPWALWILLLAAGATGAVYLRRRRTA